MYSTSGKTYRRNRKESGETMSTAAERLLLKTAKKLVYNVFMDEITRLKNQAEKDQTTKYYYDILNSGILLDVNKIKKIGIDNLYSALKKREIKPA